MKREQIKEEARQKQQKTEARLKATQSFFQQQADEAKAMFDMKMKENEKKRLEFEKRREEEAFQKATAEQVGVGKKSVFRDKGGKVIDVEAARDKAIADAIAGAMRYL